MKGSQISEALFERALALHRSGQEGQAEALLRKVIARSPRHDGALFGLSVILFEAGRYEEAIRCLERAVELRPKEPKYLTNLGEAYRRQGKLELSASALERVIAHHPDVVEARQNLALTFISAGSFAMALPHLKRVIELRPHHPVAYVMLAHALFQLGRPAESAACARRATELAPDMASARRRLGDALDALGDKSGAIASYRHAIELNPADSYSHSNLILSMLTDARYGARDHAAEARAWAKLHAEPLRQHVLPHTNDKDPARRLRVGYVSPDYRAHSTQQYLVPLFRNHDQAAVELFLYSSVQQPDAQTEWYRAYAGDHFRDIKGMDDVVAAELVRNDRIDVLVDLGLHSGGRLRVFACKPAPVQVTWLGYPGTTGLDTIDYRITDPYLDPPGTDLDLYSEESLHLPETFWSYEALDASLPVGPLPARARGVITFGCLNSPRKVNPRVLSLWAHVLREVPGSRLFLYLEEHARQAALRALAAVGVQAERVEFGGRVSRQEHLERHFGIDIMLDTFPYAGCTTTLDAIWMGVPVVTLSGGTPLHRAGVCVAMNLGLPELVANAEDEFVERAVALAGDLERLESLRASLRSRMLASPLGDVSRFARNLEAVYRTAWQRYCAKS